MHVDHVEAEPVDPLHQAPECGLIGYLSPQSCRARLYGDLAIVEFRMQRGICMFLSRG